MLLIHPLLRMTAPPKPDSCRTLYSAFPCCYLTSHYYVPHLPVAPPYHLTLMQVGPHICVFKTHVDVFDKWSDEYAVQLRQLADKHGGCGSFGRMGVDGRDYHGLAGSQDRMQSSLRNTCVCLQPDCLQFNSPIHLPCLQTS